VPAAKADLREIGETSLVEPSASSRTLSYEVLDRRIIDPELPKQRLPHLLEHREVKLGDRHDWPESVQRMCVDSPEGRLEG